MDDETIVRLFWERSQDAIGLSQRKYGALLRHIAGNILRDPRDAEEAVEDAYMRLWSTIPPQRPRYFLGYAAKLTRNAALDILRQTHRKRRDGRADVLLSELDECLASPGDPFSAIEQEELVRLINRYLAALDCTSRSLFVRRYFAMDELDELAADFCMTKHNVSARLYRVRQGLKNYLNKEGVAV